MASRLEARLDALQLHHTAQTPTIPIHIAFDSKSITDATLSWRTKRFNLLTRTLGIHVLGYCWAAGASRCSSQVAGARHAPGISEAHGGGRRQAQPVIPGLRVGSRLGCGGRVNARPFGRTLPQERVQGGRRTPRAQLLRQPPHCRVRALGPLNRSPKPFNMGSSSVTLMPAGYSTG